MRGLKIILLIFIGYAFLLGAENNFSNTLVSNFGSLSSISKLKIQEENIFIRSLNKQPNIYTTNSVEVQNSHSGFSSGIHFLEFIGAGIAPFLSTGYIFLDIAMRECAESKDFPKYSLIYLLSNISISPLITSGVGKLLKQKGSYTNSVIGTLIGSFIGFFVLGGYLSREGWAMEFSDFVLMVVFPSAGCVIGYNFK